MSAQGPAIATAAVRLVPDATNFGTAATQQLRSEITKVNTSLQHQRATLAETNRGLNDFQRGTLAATLSVVGLRGAVLAAGTSFLGGAGLVKGIEIFVGAAAQFERTLNVFQAVTQATASEMERARAEAIALGKDINLPKTSAEDAAVAMTELARGGLSVKDSLAAARGSLQLAAAAGTDFASAAQIEARALNAFNLAGNQSGRVADILANAANISTGEISDMALSLQQASAVAHQANISIEDTATAISILANAGLTGSDAGTSLRTMILRLIPQTKKAEEEMKALGVSTTDAFGNFLPFPEIIRRYHDALVRLTPAQRALTLQTIFGQDAIRASNILFSQSPQIFKRTRDAIERQGAAAQIAAARNKGLAGTFDALRSNAESILIGFGKETLPGLTGFVSGINDSLTSLEKSSVAAQGLRTAAEGISAAFKQVGSIVKTIAPPLEDAAGAAIKLTSAIGGGNIVAAVLAYKAARIAISGWEAASRRLASAISIVNAETVLTRSSAAEIAEGANKWREETSRLVLSQDELTDSVLRVQRAATPAEGIAKATRGNRALAQSSKQVVVNTAQQVEASGTYVAALVGQVKAEDEAVTQARALALAQTGLRKTTLDNAIAMEQLAQRSEEALAQSTAGIPQRGAGGRFISHEDLIAERNQMRAAADITKGLVAEEVAVTTLGQKFRNLGTTMLAFVGGPEGALLLGISAVTTAWLILGNRGESTSERLQKANEALAESMGKVRDASEEVTQARLSIGTSDTTVQEARLNVAYAKNAAQLAVLHGSTLDQRAANINLRKSTEDLTTAIRAQKDATTNLLIAELKLQGAREAGQRATEAAIEAQSSSFSLVRDLQRQVDQASGAGSRGVAETFLNDELARRSRLLLKEAQDVRATDPVLARRYDLIRSLIQLLHRAPSDDELQRIFAIKNPAATIRVGNVIIGSIVRSVKSGQEPVGQALHNMLTEAGEIAARGGEPVGEAYIQALARGIETDQSIAAAAARRAVANAISEGNKEINQSILGAESNLISIGSNISSQIAELIDKGPLGQRIQRLQTQLDNARRAAQRLSLVQGLRDASRDLQRAREQLDPTQEVGLTPAQIARRRESANDFIRPFVQRRDQAKQELQQFTTEGIIDQLEKLQQKQKETVEKGIGNVIAAFVSGRIKADEAITQLSKIIGGAKHQNNFRNAGKTLGDLFVLGFGGAVTSLFEQIDAISATPANLRKRAGTPRPEVEKPLETIAKVRQQILDAQNANTKAQRANTTELAKLTKAIREGLGRGKTPAQAQADAARGAGGRVVNTPRRGPR